MANDSQSATPVPTPEPEYLTRLREQYLVFEPPEIMDASDALIAEAVRLLPCLVALADTFGFVDLREEDFRILFTNPDARAALEELAGERLPEFTQIWAALMGIFYYPAQPYSQVRLVQRLEDREEIAERHLYNLLHLISHRHLFGVEDSLGAVEWLESWAEDIKGHNVSNSSYPYTRYLKTTHWQRTRLAALERAGSRCQLCNSTKRLNVHHRTYENLWGEQPDDLIVLCRACHAKFHDKLP